jgi:hypothetical protein
MERPEGQEKKTRAGKGRSEGMTEVPDSAERGFPLARIIFVR